MPKQTDLNPCGERVNPWWATAASRPMMLWMLILLLLALRMLWQWHSPFTLIEDEAHYWEWSRRPDWSYYSKGPGVAWVIWASTRLLGNTEFAVRLPASIATALGMYAVAKAALDMLRQQRYAFLSAVLYNCVPGIAVASMIMTIDAPYVACWAWASFFALRAIMKRSGGSWVGFGLSIAAGFLFKYTILLLLPGVLLALWVTRKNRQPIRKGWFLLGLSVSLLGLIPVVVWNSVHDWATVRHLLGHLGLSGGDTQGTDAGTGEPWTIMWSLEYIALQILVAGPVIFLAVFAWINSAKQGNRDTIIVIRAMIALALPILVFYFFVSLITETEGNWAMAAFVNLVPPAAWAVMDGVARIDRPIKFFWGASLVTGIGVLMLFPGAKTLARVPGIGGLVPLYRMSGMREHARDAQRVLDELESETGKEPIVMSVHYGRASQLAFYLPGHPVVYCTSSLVGGRKTQYDIWAQTDLRNPETQQRLLARPGLLFGGQPKHWKSAFDSLTDIGKLENEPKDHGTTYTGLNFHPFPAWRHPAKTADQSQEKGDSHALPEHP